MMDEPIDLAHKALDQGNPWFGISNLLTGNTTEWASGSLTLADIEALQEWMFDSEVQAETTTSNRESPPVTVESLEAIVKQFPPMDVLLPPVDFANIFNHTFTPEVPKSTLTPSLFDEIRWWGLDHKGRAVWILNGRMSLQVMSRLRSKVRRAERWQKIRKRQRRAAQRRHNHGKA